MKKRLISMLLVVCMVFTLVPTTAFAAEDNIPVGTSNTGDNVTIDSGTPAVCPHEHDDTCGYIEAVEGSPCTHLNEDGTYSCAPLVSGNEASPSDAAYVCNHSDSCGFIEAVAGSPCTHECELCSTQAVPPVGEDSILPPAEDCDCTAKCIAADEANEIETAIKSDCPVCGAEGADLTQCKGEAPALLEAPRASDTVYENLGATGNEANITATLSGTTLAITGSGAMKDWTSASVPWISVKDTITTVTIDEGITNIGNYAFYKCTKLTSITIPASVTSIGNSAFSNCAALTSITIPEGVTTIGEYAFEYCTALTTVTIPEGSHLTTLGNSTFTNCAALTSITIPASVTTIGRSAFGSCKALTSITIPEGVTTIGDYAFYQCKALASITIPEGVTAIGMNAFYGCSALTSVTFKGNAPTLVTGVFTNTHADLKIYIPKGSSGYTGGNWDALADKIVETQSWNIGAGSDATTVKATLSADGTTLAITGSGAMKDWEYNNFPWISVKGTITTVTIDEGITNIGNYAFSNCLALTSITIPEGVTTIGSNAFEGCAALTSITIPENVTTLGDYAFNRCSALTSITIPKSVSAIGDSAFKDSTALTSVTYAEGSQLATIGSNAFYGCSALESITIPENVTTIGSNAFNNCTALKTVTFAESSQLTTIGSKAFYDCTALESITIPVGVTAIGNYAFNSCTKLESVTFKSAAAPTLGTNVFNSTPADLKIYIPAGATDYTGDTASTEWKELASKIVETQSWDIGADNATDITATLSGTTLAITGSGAMIDWEAGSEAPWYTSNKDTITTVTIESGITNIGDTAFFHCPVLASITIPDSVTTIGKNAFNGCKALTTVTIPKDSRLATIGASAFYKCTVLTSITIPAGVTAIGDRAFMYCSALKTVTFERTAAPILGGGSVFSDTNTNLKLYIPAGATGYTGENASDNWKALANKIVETQSWNIGAGSDATTVKATLSGTTLTITGSGAMTNWEYNTIPWESVKGTITTVTIGEGITNIGEYAFYICPALASITIPDSVTTIGENAFFGCTALASITIPASVTTIGDSAFRVCTALESITIPEGVTTIGDNTFTNCAALESITIPASVTAIGDSAFYLCAALKNVIFAENSQLTTIKSGAFMSCSSLTSITIPASVTDIGGGAFEDCAALTSITIPAGVTAIGNDTFEGCAALTSITIPEGVTTIGKYAFEECAALTSITIPEGVTTIGDYAFRGSTALTSITFKRAIAPILGGSNVFTNTHINLKITIPKGATGYTGNGASAAWEELKGKIVKVTPTEDDLAYDLAAVDYNGTAQPVAVTVNIAGTGAITVKYDTSTTAPTNAGTYAITVDIAGNDQYNPVTGLSLGNYTIKKIAATPAMTTVAAGVSMSGKIDATVTLPTKPDGATYGIPIASGTITMTNMSISGNTLTYTAPTSTAGQTGIITIPVTTATNYNDYSITVTITSTAKTPQSISFADTAVSKTYGAANFTATAIRGTGDGAITYKSSDTNVATVNTTTGEVTIKGQGSTTITATAAETNTLAEATATYTLTVAKAALTITADNKSMTVGGTKPAYTATTTGLVNGETISGVTFTDGNPDTTTKGTATITPAGGTITGGGSENYTITYVNGTLTINIDVSSIDTALAAANAAKTGVTINEGVASDVASGTKFVNAAEMTALTDAIQTATDAKLTVATIAEAQSAAAALDGVVTTFKTAIKTGTKPTGGGVTPTPPSGGGSSSGGGSNVIVTPPAPNKPNDPTKAEIKIDTKVDGKGGATVNITDKNITDAIEKGAAEAKKNGDEANGIALVLRADTGNKTVNTVTVNLPKTVQEKIISNKIVSTIVVVDNPNIKIAIDLNAITEINKQAKADVNLTATKLDSGKLTGEAKTAIGTRPVFDLGVSYGSKSVSSFGAGSVTVSIPYTMQSGEKAGNVYGVYVDANGKAQWITDSSYDAVAKVLRFATSHFSTYGVGYKQDAPAFTDIASHWAKNDIEFVVARGLLSGTSGTTFSPNTAMSRGMFVTALGRMAKIDTNSYKSGNFTDVKADAYYAPYVNWAASKGITTGTTTTTFAPDQTVTRQEMAVFMQNYAKTMGYTVPKTRTAVTFADNASIGTWASDAAKSMQMAGIIMGKDKNRFDPTGTATRAEVSAVLHRYVELVIDRTTARDLM